MWRAVETESISPKVLTLSGTIKTKWGHGQDHIWEYLEKRVGQSHQRKTKASHDGALSGGHLSLREEQTHPGHQTPNSLKNKRLTNIWQNRNIQKSKPVQLPVEYPSFKWYRHWWHCWRSGYSSNAPLISLTPFFLFTIILYYCGYRWTGGGSLSSHPLTKIPKWQRRSLTNVR